LLIIGVDSLVHWAVRRIEGAAARTPAVTP